MANEDIGVSVCHALPDQVWTRVLRLPAGATAAEAIAASGFAADFPATTLAGRRGRVRAVRPDTALNDGDRLEIYRGLTFDPKESRRRRAEHRRALTARNGRERPAGLL